MPVRFRFCGDDTVPDWILSVINDLSCLDTDKLKHFVRTVVESILQINNVMENDKKLVLHENLADYKTYIAALTFIIQNATAHNVTECTLSNELQQVGLPHEHAICLCKIYIEHAKELKLKSQLRSLRCSIPDDVKCSGESDKEFVLNLEAWQIESTRQEKYEFQLNKEQANMMLYELTDVYQRMENTA